VDIVTAGRVVLPVLALAVWSTAPVHAQVMGLPVVNNGAPIGVNIGADYGSANDEYIAGGGNAVGGHVSLGFGFFGATASVSHFSPEEGDAEWSPGGALTLRLFGGPLIPFRLTAQAAAARWSVAGQHYTHVPLSLGLAATIPNPAFAIKPWVAPRVDILSHDGGDLPSTGTHFGLSGGIDLQLLNGVALRAAYDRLWASNDLRPSVFSIGIGYSR
jgi:hypothetical protein